MTRPVLRPEHLTALMVFSIAAIVGLMATGYSRFLFLTMPLVGVFLWAQRKRKRINNTKSSGAFPSDLR